MEKQKATWKWTSSLALGASAFFCLLAWSPLGQDANHVFSRKWEYQLRRWLEQDPRLDPRIKIFAFDDTAVAKFGYDDLTLKQWGELIASVGQAQPRAIVIDKIFANPLGQSQSTGFVQALASIKTPVYVGAYVSEKKIAEKRPLSLDNKWFDIAAHSSVPLDQWRSWSYPAVDVYGPAEQIGGAFAGVGHILFEGNDQVRPVVRLGQRHFIRSLGLAVAESLSLEKGGLKVDQATVTRDLADTMHVNLVAPELILNQTRSLYRLLGDSRATEISAIGRDDIVVILPAFSTGNGDFKDTPLGKYLGGYIWVSLINSVLGQKFLASFESEWLLIGIFCLFGATLPTFLTVTKAALVTFVVAGSSILVGLLSFCYVDLLMPWFMPTLAFVFTAAGSILKQAREKEAAVRRLRRDLEGIMAPEKLATVSRRGVIEATEQVVTVMFIDIVGFSTLARRGTPREVFGYLKEHVAWIRQIVHAHGGDIDRSLGDGLLCVFGYGLTGSQQRHADDAVACAIAIQQENVARTQKARSGQPVYPLRIGINTAGVFTGDLGSAERTDFTVVGAGVNFAQRLETAAEPHKVLIGQSTANLLTRFSIVQPRFWQRQFIAKNQSDLQAGFEVDPFCDQEGLFSDAVRSYRATMNLERKETRVQIPPNLLQIKTPFGLGHASDLSEKGIGLVMPTYFARGVSFAIELVLTARSSQSNRLDLQPLSIQVRWGVPLENGQFRHGCLFNTPPSGILDQVTSYLQTTKVA